MKYILSRKDVDLLAQLAWSRVLLAFDFDGTLAPIVSNREGAGMRRRTGELFRRVCELYPCAVISGRSCEDIAPRLDGARVKYLMGNHGLEPGAGIESFAQDIAGVRPRLEKTLASRPGVDIEDKRYSLAVHYRRARRRLEARDAVHAAVADLPIPMRVIAGKLVVNLVPRGAPHKGDALVSLRAQEGADTALYVGDDVTDEDVFELDQPGRLLSIRVGVSRGSAAPYFLRDQSEVDVLLQTLATLRSDREDR